MVAVLAVVAWAAAGPLSHYSETWDLVVNTGTTVVTFLMVFLIQASQNHDSRVLHLKLDELLRAVGAARTDMARLDDMTEDELDALRRRYARLGRIAAALRAGAQH